jgi:hypothetical protein
MAIPISGQFPPASRDLRPPAVLLLAPQWKESTGGGRPAGRRRARIRREASSAPGSDPTRTARRLSRGHRMRQRLGVTAPPRRESSRRPSAPPGARPYLGWRWRPRRPRRLPDGPLLIGHGAARPAANVARNPAFATASGAGARTAPAAGRATVAADARLGAMTEPPAPSARGTVFQSAALAPATIHLPSAMALGTGGGLGVRARNPARPVGIPGPGRSRGRQAVAADEAEHRRQQEEWPLGPVSFPFLHRSGVHHGLVPVHGQAPCHRSSSLRGAIPPGRTRRRSRFRGSRRSGPARGR